MPAIPYTKTATSDAAWDGPANEANLSNDEEDLRGAFAWVDPEGDPTTKTAYKGIHHEVSSDGEVGAANLAACTSLCGILNGARGGIDVPEADKEGIHAHVEHHIQDSGGEAPELKAARHPATYRVDGSVRGLSSRVERTVASRVEVRAGKNGQPVIFGHASVFNTPYIVNDWFMSFMEKCSPGCFAKTIKEADIRCLFNHDPNIVLGRTKNGTLNLAEDDIGLTYEATPPETTWARDLMTSLERGDIDQSSMGFTPVRERWGTILDPEGDQDSDLVDCRTLLEVQLYDVSPVTYAASPTTDSAVRAEMRSAGFDLDALTRITVRSYRGLSLTARDYECVRAAIDHLRRYLPPESQAAISAPVLSGHPPTPQLSIVAPTPPSHADAMLFARLAELEIQIAKG